MKKKKFVRFTALALTAALLTAPAAQALTVEQARDLLQAFYVDEISEAVLEQPAIEDILTALGDPYTEYFTPEEYGAFAASLTDASVEGIGVSMSFTADGKALLVKVFEDSPAAKAGLQAGDILVAVEGKSLEGRTLDQITDLVRGPLGSGVTVTYARGNAVKTTSMVRSHVVIPSAEVELLDGHIGWIECTSFGSETAQHVADAIDRYEDEADVWIMDLRSNGGGLLEAARDTAGLFIGEGPVVYLRDGRDNYSRYAYQGAARTEHPVMVLVDEYSASASEVFAAAVKDYGVGLVIGSRTFGKGVAQGIFDQTMLPELFPDGDALKITTDRFFSPMGNTTDQVGVIPDILVDSRYAADVAYLLTASITDETQEFLAFFLNTGLTLVDMDFAYQEEWKPVYTALLDALPLTETLALNGESVSFDEIALRYDLELANAPFPDSFQAMEPNWINVLKSYDLLGGKGDGLFHPEDTLTRAELCQMLYNALNYNALADGSTFSDVSEKAWYAPAVYAMSARGLVSGVGDGTFRPEDTLDHQQLITIMARLLQWLNCDVYDQAMALDETSLTGYPFDDYASWARSSVWLMSYSQYVGDFTVVNLLWGDPEEIDPTAAATRDEAAVMLYKVLYYLNILTV